MLGNRHSFLGASSDDLLLRRQQEKRPDAQWGRGDPKRSQQMTRSLGIPFIPFIASAIVDKEK